MYKDKFSAAREKKGRGERRRRGVREEVDGRRKEVPKMAARPSSNSNSKDFRFVLIVFLSLLSLLGGGLAFSTTGTAAFFWRF